jgi:tRNA A37 threonylcarbamoyladenosine biosynthesis protein TsaE
VLIEWPERLTNLLPSERLDIALAFSDERPDAESEARQAALTGHGRWGRRLEGLTIDG